MKITLQLRFFSLCDSDVLFITLQSRYFFAQCTLRSRINGGVLINRGLKNSAKYNKRGVGINGGGFVYFDPNDINA